MSSGFVINAGAALVAATAKTAIQLISGSTRIPTLCELGLSFNGVDPTKVPVLVELCSGTNGTAGTGTSFTPLLLRGDPSEAALATANINYSAEPGTLVVLKHWYVSPTAGLLLQFPLGRELLGQTATAARKGLALRLTAPDAVSYKAYFEFEE